MSYQRFDNGPASPPPSGSTIQLGAVQQQSTSTTNVIAAGASQPSPMIIAQQPYNHFAAKALVTKKLGIYIVLTGILTIILGVVMVAAYLNFYTSIIGSAIWSGVFVVIAGSLCIGAGANENNTCVRIGGLVMSIIGMVVVFCSCILMIIGFATGIGCNRLYCYTTFDDKYVCYNRCGWRDADGASRLSLVVAILNLVAFILMLIASIYTGRGCCCHGNPYTQGAVMTAPTQQAYAGGPVVVSSNHVHSQQQHFSQPQYPSQPQQYSQAQMPTSMGGQVTYGHDYNQQQRQEEQKAMPSTQNAPPTYSRHA